MGRLLVQITFVIFFFSFASAVRQFKPQSARVIDDSNSIGSQSHRRNPFYPHPLLQRDEAGGYFFRPANTTRNPKLSNWMERNWKNVKDKTLMDLTLPGTHDSGAFYLTPSLMPGYTEAFLEDLIKVAEKIGVPINDIITPWALSQDRSFYEQLTAGIRYIDFRAGFTGAEWATFHFEVGKTVKELLLQVVQFLDENPKEIVVIEVSVFLADSPTPGEEEQLAETIESVLGNYLFPRQDSLSFTVGQMVASGKRALVTFSVPDSLPQHPKLWPSSTIWNTYANTDKLDTMIAFNKKTVMEFNQYNWTNILFKVSWTLTPVVSTVLEGLAPGRPHSLIELADTANHSPFDQFVAYCQSQKFKIGQIFIIDHFETSNILHVVQQNL
eukprot:TRINITY_DN7920_c0_g1_i1.p1 TRINITY_DN7920_c0_g1~~TRINITY_DN7920_c0_g1_i1.p1  ORF type:complete len:384 (-),score=70.00 TRINITY_DN7920_c0_g1_i1:131-1282(-)